MNLREQLLLEHSKVNATLISNWIGSDEKRFEALMQLFLHDQHRVVQRSAWVLSLCSQQHPGLIAPYIGAMLQRCTDEGIHVAVKRNVTRILQFTAIPEEHQEAVMNLCFELMADPKEAVAVRCFSMTILEKLSRPYPEIRQDMAYVIEDALEHQELTAAFLNRGRKILRQLQAQKKPAARKSRP